MLGRQHGHQGTPWCWVTVLGHSPVLPRAEGAPVAGCPVLPPPAPACFSPPRCSRGPPCRPGRWVGLRSVGDLASARPAPPEGLRTALGRSHLLLPDPAPDPGPKDPQGPAHACASLRARLCIRTHVEAHTEGPSSRETLPDLPGTWLLSPIRPACPHPLRPCTGLQSRK